MSLLHKKEKQNKNNDPLIRLMTPMIAGILVCVFCLVSMTWAWFTASVNTPTQTIQSANRSTSVKVYEISQNEDENRNAAKTLVMPQISEEISLAEDTQTAADEGTIIAGEAAVWELAPEKTYEVVMTGCGTASTGYCKVALSHTVSGNNTPETKHYTTSAFEKDNTVKFTCNTGGFSDVEGVTETQWKEYVEKTTPPTLAIASFWGKPAEEVSVVSLMSSEGDEEEIMLLSDGDVLGLAPIPCPEAKAETEVELEGFEIQESAEISAEEDYKVLLTLKTGYEMPSEVVVNIGGKDYVVSTGGAEASEEAPYYDAETGVLTVPSGLLSDGIKVSVKATATPIPEEEPEEEETEEELTGEPTEEETTEDTTEETTEETTDDNETEDDNSADTPSDNNVAIDNPNKKEEDGEKDSGEPVKILTGGGGNDGDDDEDDNNSVSSSNDNSSSSDNNEEETEDEKADVTLNLSQLTINLEETKIPTNADLVLTLSAKEDTELPENIVITLDKTIRDENTDDEEIKEDKTEYIINTDGKDNPEGFEFDTESGELTISSELLKGVREITIADTEENEADTDDEKAALTFEVKNLTFDFTDDEIVTDEDVVITFTAGEGYELPETIIITIDGVEYIIYTSEEDSDKNPDGITFDIETGTLTISKDLLSGAEAITIAAEGIEKEDEESKEENPDADKKDESEDKDDTDNENDTEGGETTDKEPEGGTDTPNTEDKTETEDGTDAPGGENTETTTPETNPDNTTEGEDDDNNGEGNGETEPSEPNTEVTTPTTPDTEDNTNTEQDGENVETEENGEGSTDNGTEETTTPDTESGSDDETTTPTEPITPAEPSEPAVSPETPKTETPNTSEPTTGGNDGDGETGNADNASSESSSNSGNDSSKSDTSSESTTSTTPSVTPTAPTTSSPAASETSTSRANTQASGNSSSAPASSAPAPSTNSNSNGASQASGTTTPSGSKETSSEE